MEINTVYFNKNDLLEVENEKKKPLTFTYMMGFDLQYMERVARAYVNETNTIYVQKFVEIEENLSKGKNVVYMNAATSGTFYLQNEILNEINKISTRAQEHIVKNCVICPTRFDEKDPLFSMSVASAFSWCNPSPEDWDSISIAIDNPYSIELFLAKLLGSPIHDVNFGDVAFETCHILTDKKESYEKRLAALHSQIGRVLQNSFEEKMPGFSTNKEDWAHLSSYIFLNTSTPSLSTKQKLYVAYLIENMWANEVGFKEEAELAYTKVVNNDSYFNFKNSTNNIEAESKNEN
nr:MAG TPA: hypothetical protein [Caudoviricetes sp.]